MRVDSPKDSIKGDVDLEANAGWQIRSSSGVVVGKAAADVFVFGAALAICGFD